MIERHAHSANATATLEQEISQVLGFRLESSRFALAGNEKDRVTRKCGQRLGTKWRSRSNQDRTTQQFGMHKKEGGRQGSSIAYPKHDDSSRIKIVLADRPLHEPRAPA